MHSHTFKLDPADIVCSSGKELIIKASGTVKQDIEEGAYIELQVKYGLIRLIKTRADLCEQVENVDMECPIKEGKLEITKTVELPQSIPPVRLKWSSESRCSQLTWPSRANTPSLRTSTPRMIFRLPVLPPLSTLDVRA